MMCFDGLEFNFFLGYVILKLLFFSYIGEIISAFLLKCGGVRGTCNPSLLLEDPLNSTTLLEFSLFVDQERLDELQGLLSGDGIGI